MTTVSQNHSAKGRLTTGLLVVFITMVTLVVINSHLTRWFLLYWFEKQGAEVTVEDLKLNLWDSQLEINTLTASNEKNQQLNIKHLKVDWRWQPLFSKVVQVDTVTVQSMQLDIVGDKLKPQSIGPIDLAQWLSPDDTTPSVKPEPSDWQIKLGAVELADFNVCYRDLTYQYADMAMPVKDATQRIDNCIVWQQLALNSWLTLNGPDGPNTVALNGDIKIKAFKVKNKSGSDWFELDVLNLQTIAFVGDKLGWQALELNNLQLFAPDKQQLPAYVGAGFSRLTTGKLEIDLSHQQLDLSLLGLDTLWLTQQGVDDKSQHKVNVASVTLASLVGGEPKVDIGQLVVIDVDIDSVNAEGQAHSQGSVKKLTFDTLAGSLAGADIWGLSIDGVNGQHTDTVAKLDITAGIGQLAVNRLNGSKDKLTLGQFQLHQVEVSHTDKHKDLDASAKVAKLTADTIDGSLQGGIVTQLMIDGIEAKHQAEDIQTLATVKKLAMQDIQGSKTDGRVRQLAVDGSSVKQRKGKEGVFPLVDVDQLTTADLSLNLTDLQATIEQFAVAGISLWQKASDNQYHPAVKLAQLSVAQATVDKLRQQLTGISLSRLGLLPDLSKNQPTAATAATTPLLSLAKLQVDTVTAADSIAVGEVVASGFDGLLSVHPEAGLNLANWFYVSKDNEAAKANTEANTEGSTEERTKDEPTGKSKVITVKRLALTQSANLTVIDHTLDKPQTHRLSKLNFELGYLALGNSVLGNSALGNLALGNSVVKEGAIIPATVEFSAQIEQSGLLSGKGTFSPEPDALFVDLAGKLAHLGTTHYSDYSARHIGYRIDQGQLNIDFAIKVDNNQLDSQLELLLKKFELAKLQQHEKSVTNAELGVPLPLALNLLRDSDDNIELSIPIKGDLNKPDFSLSSVITLVTFKALKTAVLYNYSPLSVLSLAGGLLDLATALRFKSVAFANADVSLNADAKAQLDKVGKVLGDKARVDLVLCANLSLLDHPLIPVTTENDKGEKVVVNQMVELSAVSETQRQLLTELANNRQQAAKAYLVEQHHIAEHRLLLCNVKFSAKADAKPVVAISL